MCYINKRDLNRDIIYFLTAMKYQEITYFNQHHILYETNTDLFFHASTDTNIDHNGVSLSQHRCLVAELEDTFKQIWKSLGWTGKPTVSEATLPRLLQHIHGHGNEIVDPNPVEKETSRITMIFMKWGEQRIFNGFLKLNYK